MISRTPLGTWLGVMLLLFAVSASAARIQVSLDRNPVPLNEGFTLTFYSDESPDGDPDFGPLQKDFEILSSAVVSSNRSLVNGHASQHYEWQLPVIAKRPGTLEIPAIAFGDDHSEPFSVTVLPGSAKPRGGADDSGILLEVEAEPRNPYVQAQVIYTVRVLSRVAVGNAGLSEPEAADTLIQKLESAPSGVATRNGVQYRVTEIRYAIFPQKSGRLNIGPIRLEAQIASGRSPFNPFFSRAARTQRLQSDAVELDVRPIPAAFTGKHWLPASHLELEDSWAGEPPRAAAGEPSTRTLAVLAEAATVGVLPDLAGAMAAADGIKQYSDQPLLKEDKLRDGLSSLRREKIAVIASRPGTYRVPAVEIPWWNVQTDRMETARLPERVLTVSPSARTAEPPAPEPLPEAQSGAAPAPATVPAMPVPGGPWWPWLALFFGLGWLATASAWWFGRGRPERRPQLPSPDLSSERRLADAVGRACRDHDPAAARKALAAWAAYRWPGSGGQGTEVLERNGGADLARELDRLKRALYTRNGTEWRGGELWRSFEAYRASGKATVGHRAAPELEPLYKL